MSKIKRYIIPLCVIAFFMILWYMAPLGIYPDSGSYMSMQPGREPIYPLFLAFFRKVFRERDTLVWLAASGALDSPKALKYLKIWPALHVSTAVQSLLGAISCIYLAETVKKTFKLKGIWVFFAYGITLIPYVITPLFSSSRMVLGRAVLTEGLAFPLFGFFVGAIIREVCDRSVRFPVSLPILLILVLTRNQMLLYLPVWALLRLLSELAAGREHKEGDVPEISGTSDAARPLTPHSPSGGFRLSNLLRQLAFVALSCLIFMGCRTVFNSVYTGIFNQGYSGASTGPYNMLTTYIYLGDEADASNIKDPEHRRIYLDLLRASKERELNHDSAPRGILPGAYHYEDAYDTIGFEIQQPIMFEEAAKMGVADGDELDTVIAIATSIRNDLSGPMMGRYIQNYLRNFMSGLVRSVAASGRIMGIYACIVYMMAAALMVYGFIKGRTREAFFMLSALVMCFANAAATALMIMCLSRYMIYNTPVFYLALMCLFRAVALRGDPSSDKEVIICPSES